MHFIVARGFLSGASWVAASSAAAKLLGLFSAIILSRELGRHGYGEVGVLMSTLMLFGIFAQGSLGAACSKFVSKYSCSQRSLARASLGLVFVLVFALSAVATVVMFAGARFVAGSVLHAEGLSAAIRVTAIALFATSIVGVMSGALAGLQCFRAKSLLDLVQPVLYLAILLGPAPPQSAADAMGAYAASLVSTVLVGGMLVASACRRQGMWPTLRGCRLVASPILSFMPPMIGNALLVVAVAWLCNVILARQANGFAELGLYVAANQWRAMIVFIPFAVQSVAAPLLSKAYGAGDDAAFTHVYDNAFRTTLLSSALPAMVAIAFNDVIMGAFGKSFASEAWILILIAFTSVLMAIANFLGLILQMRDAVWATLFATTASAATAISGAYLFSPGRGAIGLATALLLASLIQVLVLASVVAQRVAVDVRQLLKMSTLCLLTIGGVAMVAISVPGSIPAKTAALCISSVVLIAICSRGTFAAGSWRPIRTTSGNSFLAMKSQEEAENARS